MKFLKFLLLFIILGNTMIANGEVLNIKQDEKKGTWGYVNEKGKWTIKPKYLDATNFFYPYKQALEKIAFVSSEPGKVQIINKAGKILVEFESSESRMENFRTRIEKNPLYESPYMFTEIPIGNDLNKLLGIIKDEYDIFEPTFEEIYPLIETYTNKAYKPEYNEQSFLKKNNGKIDYISFEIDPTAIYNKKDLSKRRIKIDEHASKFNNNYLIWIKFRELEPGIILAEYRSGGYYDPLDSPDTSLIVDGKYSAWRKFVDEQNNIKIFDIPDLPESFVLFDGQLIRLKRDYVYEWNTDKSWIGGMTTDNKFIFGIKSSYNEKLLDIDVEGEYLPDRWGDRDYVKVEQKNGNDFFIVDTLNERVVNPFKTIEEADSILAQSGEKEYIKALKLYLDAVDMVKAFSETQTEIYNKIVENIFKECDDKAAIIRTVKSYEPSEFINTTIYRYNTWGPGYLFPNKSGGKDLYSLDGRLIIPSNQINALVKFNPYNENLIIIKKDGKYGAFNLNGDQVIAPTHTEFARDNSAKKRFCYRDRLANGADKYFVYDDNGNLLAQEVFTDLNSQLTKRRIQNFLSTWM